MPEDLQEPGEDALRERMRDAHRTIQARVVVAPVAGVRHRLRRRWRLQGALLALLLIAVAVPVTAVWRQHSSVARLAVATASAGDVVAVDLTPAGPAVVLLNLDNGRPVRTLHQFSHDPTAPQLRGLDTDAQGRVYVALGTGPACSSDVAGCGPRPATCGGRVLRLDPVTGDEATVLTVPADVGLWGVAVSPDASHLATTQSDCLLSFGDRHVFVTSSDSRSSWSIGAGLPNCHSLADVHFTADGRHLSAVYAPAATADYSGPSGTCAANGPSTLVTVPALSSQPGWDGAAEQLPRGCVITSAAPSSQGFLQLRLCNPSGGSPAPDMQGALDGQLSVDEISASYQRLHTISLGSCQGGGEVTSVNPSRAAISVYRAPCARDQDPPRSQLYDVDLQAGSADLRLDAIQGYAQFPDLAPARQGG